MPNLILIYVYFLIAESVNIEACFCHIIFLLMFYAIRNVKHKLSEHI